MSKPQQANPQEYVDAQNAKALYTDAVKFCMEGSVDKLKNLLNKYMVENPLHKMDIILENYHSEGKTMLHIAAASGHSHVVEALLENVEKKKLEIIINLKDCLGFTPLMNGTISESISTMRKLIEYGADVNIMNNSGTCAAHFAAADGSVERLSILFNAGADLNYVSLAGTPLHWATGKQKLDAVKYITYIRH
jgi:hypothetical protein